MELNKTLRELRLARLELLAAKLVLDGVGRSCTQFREKLPLGGELIASATTGSGLFQVQVSGAEASRSELRNYLLELLGQPVRIGAKEDYEILQWVRSSWKEALGKLSPSAASRLDETTG